MPALTSGSEQRARWFVVMLSGLAFGLAQEVGASGGSVAGVVGAASTASVADPCGALAAQDFSSAVGTAVTLRAAAVVAATAALPAYCRVVANVAPRNTVEIRLPQTGWQGRLLMAGCGGLCGAIQMERTDDALARRYAVAHTDMGHAEADMAFALDPQALEDFAHRSTHVATRLLKAVARAYYARPHRYAYFRGCSSGGRQGITAALLYPDDFDGIVAGAPAAGAAVPNIAWALRANTRRDGSSILDAAAIRLLHASVLQSCDRDDGVADGVVGNPPSCAFEPRQIACSGSNAAGCLTAEQVEAARRIYGGVRNPDGSAYASVGYAKGGELGWLRTLVTTRDAPAGMSGVARNYLMRFADLPNPPQSLADLDFSKLAVRLAPVDALPSFGPDGRRMAAFQRAGGKLLMYHTWSDDSLTPATSIDVYGAHERAFGGSRNLDPFMRLFMIPGVYHCRGGDGPDAVDFLDAIARWVEQGRAPAKLIAFKAREPVPLPREYSLPLPANQVVSSLAVFPYPAGSGYSGSGDPRDAANWRRR